MIFRPIVQFYLGFLAELETRDFFKIQLFGLESNQNLLKYPVTSFETVGMVIWYFRVSFHRERQRIEGPGGK